MFRRLDTYFSCLFHSYYRICPSLSFVLAHTTAGNCFGIAIVFLLGYLVTLRTTFVDVYSPASIFIVSVMAACLALLATFQGAKYCFDFLCPFVFTSPPFHCFSLFININYMS